MATASKGYLYKVYQPYTTTVTNGVFDGDFEGEVGSWSTYWTAYNSGPTLVRNRPNAYPSSPVGQAMNLNGTNSYVALASSGTGFNDLSSIPTLGVIGWFYKPSWTDGLHEALFSNDYIDTTAPATKQQMGFGIHKNFTAGYLSVIATTLVSSLWTQTEAKVLLSSLSNGWHQIAGLYDGNNTTLFVDGAQVATSAIGSGGHNIYYGTTSQTMVGIGANRVATGTAATKPSGNYFVGSIHTLSIHYNASGAPITSGMVSDNYTNHTLQTTNVIYAFNFGLNSNSYAYDLINGVTANVVGDSYSTGIIETEHSLKFTTSTGGSTTQGIKSTTAGRVNIVGGNTYTASAYVKGTAGMVMNLTITPIGGGSPSTRTQTLVSGWNRLTLTYTFNNAATQAELDIYLSSANTSAQTVYVDQVMLETGSTAHSYFNRYTPNTVGASYSFDNVNQVYVAEYSGWNYVTTWNDVQSDIEFPSEINGAGGELSVTLQRAPENFGEGSDIALGNRVDVSVISDTYPNGLQRFSGEITRYQNNFNNNNINISLLSFGAQLNDYYFEGSAQSVINQFDITGSAVAFYESKNFGAKYAAAQSFTTSSNQTDIKSIDIYLQGSSTATNFSPIGSPVQLTIYPTYADMLAQTNPLATAKHIITSNTYYWANFTLSDNANLPTKLSVLPNTTYYWRIQRFTDMNIADRFFDVATSYSTAIIGSQYYSIIFNGTADVATAAPAGQSFAFRINQSYGQTTIQYTASDPGQMLRDVLDDGARQGLYISYDSTTVELTGTTTDYTFANMTILDAVKKILELCPAGWYWYIDQATNMLHLHPRSSATTHSFVRDKHFKSLNFEKNFETLINTIYFTGGQLAPGVNFFKKYQDAPSVAIYGQKIYQYNDVNVISATVADRIVSALLSTQNVPTIRTTMEIIDGTYDIETIKVGDVVRFRGFQSSNGSLWDVAKWDVDKWDFDITDPQTYELQIVRFNYRPDSVALTLSTNAPDIARQVDQIKRSVQALINVANPTSPSS